MADIKQSALELIGNTPILQLNRYSEKAGIKDVTLCKAGVSESGWFWGIIALAMIEDAEKKVSCNRVRQSSSLHQAIQASALRLLQLPKVTQGNPDTAGYNEC